MTINELLARLNDTDNPIEDMGAFITEVETAHENALSIRDAKVKSVEEQFSALEKKHDKLKITNYDLMMSKPAEPNPDDEGGSQDEPTPGDQGVDSLFADPTN